MADIADLRERLREEWLRKATSSFTCQECGIQANFIDALDAAQAVGWQPIEGAPAMGVFLVAIAGPSTRAVTCTRTSDGGFIDEFGDTYRLDGRPHGMDADDQMTDGYRLAVWHPLPAPPSRSLLNKEEENG